MFSKSEKSDFLLRVRAQFLEPDKIDKAVLDSAQVRANGLPISMRELDAYGVFNPDGSLDTKLATLFNIKFNEARIRSTAKNLGMSHLSLREQIMLDGVVNSTINDLSDITNHRTLELMREQESLRGKHDPESEKRLQEIAEEQEFVRDHQPAKGLADESFKDFWPPNAFKFVNPLSMELSGPAKQMMGMGHFNFPETNLSISPGPNHSTTTNEHDYDFQHDMAGYLNNLLTHNVGHVFAMGRVYPYHPQDMDGEMYKEHIGAPDFINYFIPDESGQVVLPDIPEFENMHVTSHPVRKAGRFISYEISINGSKPIQIHHMPIRDKQPLELTDEELAYVKEINQAAHSNPEAVENIHAHCRGGKGRSAQIVYLFAAMNPKYADLTHEDRLAQMRKEKITFVEDDPAIRHGQSSFVETPVQVTYLQGAIGKIDTVPDQHSDNSQYLHILYGILLKKEIDQLVKKHGMPGQGEQSEEQKLLMQLMEQYQDLNSVSPDKLEQWANEVKANPLVSESLKIQLSSENIYMDVLLSALKEDRKPAELTVLFDLQARNGSFKEFSDPLTKEWDSFSDVDGQEKVNALEKIRSYLYRGLCAHLNASKDPNSSDVRELIVEVELYLEDSCEQIIEALKQKTLTRDEFENLRKEFLEFQQLHQLLQKNIGPLSTEFRKVTEFAQSAGESIFALGYDRFETDPDMILLNMEAIYSHIGQLYKNNELSPQKWDELKIRFNAYKNVFNFVISNQDSVNTLSKLDNLFQDGRDSLVNLSQHLQKFVEQVKPEESNLEDYIATLGIALLDEIPEQYFNGEGQGFYSTEINQLVEAIQQLAETYTMPKPNGVIDLNNQREIPSPEEYIRAREQVQQLISQHVPLLVTKNTLEVRLANLERDFARFEKSEQKELAEFKELGLRLASLKSEHQHSNNVNLNDATSQLIASLEKRNKDLSRDIVDLSGESQRLKKESEEKYQQSKEFSLRTKAYADAVKSGLVKTSDPIEKPLRYMVEFNYHLGLYNDLIAYLNKDYDLNSINKTLESYVTSIPQFATQEFRHSPIVLHVKLSTINERLAELSSKKEVQDRYKQQFLDAAIERYQEMPKDLQEDLHRVYFKDSSKTLDEVEDKLRELKTNPPSNPKELVKELTALKAKVNHCIHQDELFTKQIGPTFVGARASLLRHMLIGGMFASSLDHLSVENEKVRLQDKHEETQTMFYSAVITHDPNIYCVPVPETFKDIPEYINSMPLIQKQYEHVAQKAIKEQYDNYLNNKVAFSVFNTQKQTVPTLEKFVDGLLKDLQIKMGADVTNCDNDLKQCALLESILKKLPEVVPYQRHLDELQGQPPVDYTNKINALKSDVATYKTKIESSDQYKAKKFLEQAEKYLISKNWDVSFQWDKHVIEGTDKKIPATVAKQLAEIKAARQDGDYSKHKAEFVKIGKEKELSWRSSKTAREYYSLFKSENPKEDIAKHISEELNKPGKV